MKKRKIFLAILGLLVSSLLASTVKFFIGNNKDKASRENFYAYIRQIKQQSDFVSFDYWLGVAIENTSRTVQQINSELREQAREYSRKMARRPSLGMEAGYYASLLL